MLSQFMIELLLVAQLLDKFTVGLIKVSAMHHVESFFHEDVPCFLQHGRDQEVLVKRNATANTSRCGDFSQRYRDQPLSFRSHDERHPKTVERQIYCDFFFSFVVTRFDESKFLFFFFLRRRVFFLLITLV